MGRLGPNDRPDLGKAPPRGSGGARRAAEGPIDSVQRAIELGDLYFTAENFAVALEHYRRALDIAPTASARDGLDRRFRIGSQIVECLRHRGDIHDAIDALHDLHRRLRPYVTREQVGRLSASLAILLYERGQYRSAQRSAHLAFRLLRDTSLNFDIGRTEMILGLVAFRTGEWNVAREQFESAFATYRRAGYEAGMATAYNNLALLHKNQCRYKEAARFLEQALRIAERAGMYHDACTYVHNLGLVHERMGDWDLAEEHYRRGLQMSNEVGHATGKIRALTHLGNLRRKRRDFGSAETALKEALALTEERGYKRQAVIIHEFLADLAFDRGQHVEARDQYIETLTAADEIAPESDLTIELLRRLAESTLALDDASGALRYAGRGLQIARRLGDRVEEGCLLRVLGLARMEEGDLADARAALEQAHEILHSIGNRYELARLGLAAGIALRKRGRRGRARGLLDESVGYLRRAVAAFEGLASPALTGRSLVELTRSELQRGLFDEAVIHLDHAASLIAAEDDPELAQEIDATRLEVEQGLIEGTAAQKNEFAALEEIQKALRGSDAEVALQDVLAILSRRAGASRGFIAAPAGSEEAEVVASVGMSTRVARELLGEFERRIGATRLATAPVVTSRIGSDERFRDVPSLAHLSPRTSVALLPLPLPSGLSGHLYMDRAEDGSLGPFKQREINLMAVLANYASVGILELQRQRLAKENTALRGRLLGTTNDFGIVTRSPELLEILSLLDRVGPTDATILIEGETGSGKGLLARAVHAASARAERPLIQVNCAALPEQLLESELFGHVQGAFTGAVRDKVGLFVEANGGTLFLDEVDKTTITIQGKLLQVLDNREVRPVGGNRPTKVDVRVVCATNVSLKARIARGDFLEDLYYRLNDITFRVPPLRERPEDIPPLLEHYCRRFASEMGKEIAGIEPDLITVLAGLPWRGNVRELEKVVKRMVVMANDGDRLSPRLLPREILQSQDEATSEGPSSLRAEVAKVERRLIAQALEKHGWNRLQAARELSLSYPTLLQKIKLFRLDRRAAAKQRA